MQPATASQFIPTGIEIGVRPLLPANRPHRLGAMYRVCLLYTSTNRLRLLIGLK